MGTTIGDKILSSLEFTSGCTEPAAIALAASWVGRYTHAEVDELLVELDQRTYKNAYAAGIPNGCGKTGAEYAAAFGFRIANPSRKLSIFLDLNDMMAHWAIRQVEEGHVKLTIIPAEHLDIRISAVTGDSRVTARIAESHTNLVMVDRDGEPLVKPERKAGTTDFLSFDDTMYDWTVWESLVDAAYRHDLLRETIEKGIRCNAQAARHGSSYISNGRSDLVTGAIWSRMSGDPVMVMSCAGSGNKGLTSIVPVIAEAEARGVDGETLTRCVILSTLVTSLVTARFGTVSSACGVLYAAGAGLVAAFLFLRGRLNLFQEAYRNYISAVAGGFCDGAKGSCAMRGHSAVRNAMSAVRYAENGFSMGMRDGFLGRDFKETLDYLAQYNPTITQLDDTTIDILKKKEGRQNC